MVVLDHSETEQTDFSFISSVSLSALCESGLCHFSLLLNSHEHLYSSVIIIFLSPRLFFLWFFHMVFYKVHVFVLMQQALILPSGFLLSLPQVPSSIWEQGARHTWGCCQPGAAATATCWESTLQVTVSGQRWKGRKLGRWCSFQWAELWTLRYVKHWVLKNLEKLYLYLTQNQAQQLWVGTDVAQTNLLLVLQGVSFHYPLLFPRMVLSSHLRVCLQKPRLLKTAGGFTSPASHFALPGSCIFSWLQVAHGSKILWCSDQS